MSMVKTRKRINEIKAKGLTPLPVRTFLNGEGKVIQLKPVVVPPKPQINVYGITETLEAIDLIAAIANAIFKVAVTGWSVGFVTGVWYGVPVIMKLIPAISGIGNVLNELDDLTEPEKQVLIARVKEKLTFEDNVEAVVTTALDVLYKIKLLAGVFK